ncbi:MAG: leucine-rich repeat domain-containing protein [Alistipes sp.]|nr:leucine-rich repeat domain-containing protein [Alistipes sp.]
MKKHFTLLLLLGVVAMGCTEGGIDDGGGNNENNIQFVDSLVRAMCVANWDTDGDGELSYDEAAAVTDIGTTFRGAEITSFDEFEYFTGLTSISEYAFQGCYNLTSINIPNGVTTIGDVAFYGCISLTNVTIPDGITKFGISAFNGCFKLTTITIPDGTTEIGGYAFCDCVSLTNVIIPDSVTTIGYAIFSGCFNMQEFQGKFASEDGRCLIVDGVLNSFAPAGLTEYTISNGITVIGHNAFENCDSLTSVTIPDSITEIGGYAFYLCDSLTSITIPDSVTAIGVAAFAYCDNLQEFNSKFATEDRRGLIVDGVFNSFAPAGLTEYVIPDGVTEVGEISFYSCGNLTNITIPESVTCIGYNAFAACNGLISVVIPDSVTKIDVYAFGWCERLTDVTIGSSVEEIGDMAFKGCNRLASVYCRASVPPILGSEVFKYFAAELGGVVNIEGAVYVPAGSVAVYKSNDYWSEYADNIVAYDYEKGEVVE